MNLFLKTFIIKMMKGWWSVKMKNPLKNTEPFKIENVHKRNFILIKKYKLKVGTELANKKTGQFSTITSIHPLYGWVETSNSLLKQDMSNIKEFNILK